MIVQKWIQAGVGNVLLSCARFQGSAKLRLINTFDMFQVIFRFTIHFNINWDSHLKELETNYASLGRL